MSSKEAIKILLVKKGMTITQLAKELTALTGKKYSRDSLSHRISRSAIRYDEMELIAKILEYEIEFKDLTKS